MKRFVLCMAALVMFLSITGITQAVLINNPDAGAFQIQFATPAGQSFTAEDSLLTEIGFFIEPFNQFFNDLTISYELRLGEGTGGALLDSATFALPNNFKGFHTITNFNDIPLISGNKYTALILNDTPQWAFRITNANVYAGGVGFRFGNPGTDNWFKAGFQPIPEPSTYLLFGIGILAIFGMGYRQRKKAA